MGLIYRTRLTSPGEAVKCSTGSPRRSGAPLRGRRRLSGLLPLRQYPRETGPTPHLRVTASLYSSCDAEIVSQCLCEGQIEKRVTACLLRRPLQPGPAAEPHSSPSPPTSSSSSYWRCDGALWGELTATPEGSTLLGWSALSNAPKSKEPERGGQERFDFSSITKLWEASGLDDSRYCASVLQRQFGLQVPARIVWSHP